MFSSHGSSGEFYWNPRRLGLRHITPKQALKHGLRLYRLTRLSILAAVLFNSAMQQEDHSRQPDRKCLTVARRSSLGGP